MDDLSFADKLREYIPFNEQEAADKELILGFLRGSEDVFSRKSLAAHMTASAWVVNAERTKVLLAYHNIYASWSWLGGHADGDRDLLSAAMREVREESGLKCIRAVSQDIYSIEVLPVFGHIKRGEYVSSHLHLNATYLLEADERATLTFKPDENSGVRWFDIGDIASASSEPWFIERIYGKLNEKLSAFV